MSPVPLAIPDHFYGESNPQPPPASPEDDILATRGIPVFRPTMSEFCDFERYMETIERWGMVSGIVKVIPPAEWKQTLPTTYESLSDIQLKNPIEQRMVGHGGLFRQQNVEKRRTMTLREWVLLGQKEGMTAPGVDFVDGRRKADVIRKPLRTKPSKVHLENSEVMTPAKNDQDGSPGPDVASSLPTPPASVSTMKLSQEERQTLNADFLRTFDPHTSWLPPFTRREDYTPEFCRDLERVYWRNCSFGTPPWYGADMAGSLFTEKTRQWNVASLPSLLSRLIPINSTVPGVNTPYLYFGLWRATFAWHVEDMDLFSINYIHWGAPKFWYAVPQARATAFEEVMKSYFPADKNKCPQFLRHKSYLASPTVLSQSSCRPNTLVQHSGEFVITFPRGYHAGFNMGLNCAESTNFALQSWVDLGKKARICECVSDSVRIDVEQLMRDMELEKENPSIPPPRPERKRKKVSYLSDDEDDPSWAWLKKARREHSPAGSITITRIPSLSSRFVQDPSPPLATVNKPKPVKVAKPKPPPIQHFTPCCLCPSQSLSDLLPVFEPPPSYSGGKPEKDASGNLVWRAHGDCARVIPETWVDDYTTEDGQKTTYVFGVDVIVKDRWTLRCVACTDTSLKAHGAPIQCTKGKCSRAFHVSCAKAGVNGISYRVVGVDEKEVVLVDEITPEMNNGTPRTVIKTISKDIVESYCSQHNPTSQNARKASKTDQLRRDVLALEKMSRVKIRSGSGVFEVTLTSVDEATESLSVVWDDGGTRVFKWSSIIWESTAPPKTAAPRPSTSNPNRKLQGHAHSQKTPHATPVLSQPLNPSTYYQPPVEATYSYPPYNPTSYYRTGYAPPLPPPYSYYPAPPPPAGYYQPAVSHTQWHYGYPASGYSQQPPISYTSHTGQAPPAPIPSTFAPQIDPRLSNTDKGG